MPIFPNSTLDFSLMFIYFFERKSASKGGAHREKKNPKQARLCACHHRTWRGARSHETWDGPELISRVRHLTDWATQVPLRLIFFFFCFKCLFVLERERKHEQGRDGGVVGGEIQNPKQAPGCPHRAQRGARTHKLWYHDLNWSWTLNWRSHPGIPFKLILNPS